MTVETKVEAPREKEKREQRHSGKAGLVRPPTAGEFARQSILLCYLTDFIDTTASVWGQIKKTRSHWDIFKISAWKQAIKEKAEEERLEQIAKTGRAKLTLKDMGIFAVVGEVVGDLLGGVGLWAAEKFMPGLSRGISKGLGLILEPLYDFAGHRGLLEWRTANNLSKDNPEYKQKHKEWKENQMHNLGLTVVLFSAATIGNIATQFALTPIMNLFRKDTKLEYQNMGDIVKGKMFGVALTTALILAMRGFTPRFAHRLDRKLDRAWDRVSGFFTGGKTRTEAEHHAEIRKELGQKATDEALETSGPQEEKNTTRFTALATMPPASHRKRVENETPSAAGLNAA